MPVLRGRKSPRERFPGAVETFTTEAMMRDRKALQAATSHYLGDEFARAYGVSYTGRDGAAHHPFATSWGASSRLVGGLIMTHGDDRGLRLPPALAPHQAVVIPIVAGDGGSAVAEAAASACASQLRDGRHARAARRPRPRAPRREVLRVGAEGRAAAASSWAPATWPSGRVTLARRDGEGRQVLPLDAAAAAAPGLLGEIQQRLYDQALDFRERHTARLDERAALLEYLAAGPRLRGHRLVRLAMPARRT